MLVVQCPCGAQFKADDRWSGRRARCKQCGRELVIGESPAGCGDESSDPISLIDDALELDKRAASSSGRDAGFQPPRPIIETGAPESVVAGSSFGPFVKQCLWSMALFCDPGSMATFFVLAVLVCFSTAAVTFLGCFGWFLAILVCAMICAMLFATVEEAAAGREALPSLEVSEDGWAGMAGAVLKFLGTIGIVILPAVAFASLHLWFDFMPEAPAETVTTVLTWAGIMFWPMVVLIVAMGDFGSLLRIDLIAVTIARTLPAYVLLCAFVSGTYAAVEWAQGYLASATGGGGHLAATIGSQVLSTYGMLVCMCIIGFYYHHFKHRFAWSWG